MGELAVWIIGTVASAAIIALGGLLLTKPRIKLSRYGKNSLEILVLEKDDMTANSTSGLYEITWRAAEFGVQREKRFDFAYLILENNPILNWADRNTAKGVSVHINCMGVDSNHSLNPYYARPMETPAPFTSEFYGLHESAKVDIPPGSPKRGFYIAFRDPTEECFYGFSNVSYTYYQNVAGHSKKYYDWKNPELKMDKGEYIFKITIDGVNIKPRIYTCIVGPDLVIEMNNRKSKGKKIGEK